MRSRAGHGPPRLAPPHRHLNALRRLCSSTTPQVCTPPAPPCRPLPTSLYANPSRVAPPRFHPLLLHLHSPLPLLAHQQHHRQQLHLQPLHNRHARPSREQPQFPPPQLPREEAPRRSTSGTRRHHRQGQPDLDHHLPPTPPPLPVRLVRCFEACARRSRRRCSCQHSTRACAAM